MNALRNVLAGVKNKDLRILGGSVATFAALLVVWKWANNEEPRGKLVTSLEDVADQEYDVIIVGGGMPPSTTYIDTLTNTARTIRQCWLRYRIAPFREPFIEGSFTRSRPEVCKCYWLQPEQSGYSIQVLQWQK